MIAARLHVLGNAKGDGTGTIILHLPDFKYATVWNSLLEQHGWTFVKDVVVGSKEGARQMGPSAQSVMPTTCDHYYVWQLNQDLPLGTYRNNFMWYANKMKSKTKKKKKNSKKKTGADDGEPGNAAERKAMSIGDEKEGEDEDQYVRQEKKQEKAACESPKTFWADHFALDKKDYEVPPEERRLFERVIEHVPVCESAIVRYNMLCNNISGGR
jgi:hypothetical protein